MNLVDVTQANRRHENDTLLAGIEETRDALNLPPGDAAWDVHAPLKADDDADDAADAEREKVVAETSALRGSLRASSSRLDELERQLASKQCELDAARAAARVVLPAAPEPDPAERERLRNLRTKVEELEGLVRAGNMERGDLRRQLAVASSTARTAAAVAMPPGSDDIDEPASEPVTDVERDIALPNLGRRVLDSLGEVPNSVAAEALRTIGGLAAGDASAWRRVKQAKDMPRQVLMARIGIHYRMLFRLEARTLEVIDLVTRENLMTTLKRMRLARS